MQNSLVNVLIQYPILTLFLVIGLGYIVGQLSIFGFRFGLAGVLFVGLGFGALHPSIALPEVVPTLGLIIFVYTIGIHSGRAFFDSFRREGVRDSLLVVALLTFGAVVALAISYALPLSAAKAAGLYCGGLTNAPALAAAQELIRESARDRGLTQETVMRLAAEPVAGFGIAYPFGVVGVLLAYQLARKLWQVEMPPAPSVAEILVRDYEVRNPGVVGRTIGEVLRLHKNYGFVISRIQHEGKTDIATSDTVLHSSDIVAVVGEEESLERAEQIFGAPAEARIESDRKELDYRRVFVSSKNVVGKRIRELDVQDRLGATITRVKRGDIDVVPSPDARLEYGDRVRVLTRRSNFAAVSQFFGDSIKGTAETDFASVAIGMVLGVLAGMLPIPLPGGANLRLGLAGGPLLVALILGKLERSGRITWIMPISANLTLRQIGLLLFLGGIGTRAGFSFAETLRTNGLEMLLAGAAITWGVALPSLIVGHKVLKMPFDALMGMTSGMHTEPASLTYANSIANSDAPNTAYARVYPVAMITKIILAQVLVSFPLGRAPLG